MMENQSKNDMFRYFSKRNRIKRKLRKLACKEFVLQSVIEYWNTVHSKNESVPASFIYEQADRGKAWAKLKFRIKELEKELAAIP